MHPLLRLALLATAVSDVSWCDFVQYVTMYPTGIPIPSTTPFQVPGFGPQLGTLELVIVESSIEWHGEATFTNITPDPRNVITDVRLLIFGTGKADNPFHHVLWL